MLNYTKIREYLKKHRQNSILHKILTGAAAVVIFVTTYALILPAITLETKPACGIEEHAHNELDCYSNTGELICQLEVHTHAAECYPAEEIVKTISSNETSNETATGETSTGETSTVQPESGAASNTVSSNETSNITSNDTTGALTGADVSSNDQVTDTVSDGDASEILSEEITLIEKSAYDGKVVVTAGYTESAQIPEEAKLVAYQVTAENASERYESRQEEIRTILGELSGTEISQDVEFLLYNVGFYVDGKEIEPADTVKMTIQLPADSEFWAGDPVTVIHFAEAGTETIKGTYVTEDEAGNLYTSFEMSSFSDIALAVYDLDWAEDTAATLAADGTVIDVGSESALRAAIENRTFNGTINITNDFEITGGAISMGAEGVADQNITINLNNHKITCAGTLVNIYSGSTLEITGATGNVAREEITKESATILNYDKTAVYNAETETLIYYVTETAVTDASTGATQETLVKYTVTGQGILTGNGSGASIFNVDGGTLNLSGGMLAGSAQRALYVVNGGIANLTGGYICGNSTAWGNADLGDAGNWDGGGVYASGSTVNVSGTVVAGNKANYGGGIHATNSSTVNISNTAIISGNTAVGRGGGVDTYNSDINMSGGYVTNNVSQLTDWYYAGGGGIMMRGGTGTADDQLKLSGGYITGNKAYSGGGIFLGEGANTGLIMTGGFVTANYASTGEGGGIRIDHSCIGRIAGGYITNNVTDTPGHWGGGGLFIADAATCQVLSVLVTNNSAGGFGGGVAGCSTGRIMVSAIQNDTKGAAIYENKASGTNLSGSDSIKQQDHMYAYSNDAFMKDKDFQDYFCMLYSNVTDAMLGNGSQNWKGSIDGVNVTIPAGESMVGNSVVGLTAYPTEADKNAAEATVAALRDGTNTSNLGTDSDIKGVYINGNSSNTHGGGVLCNGYMVLGALEEGTDNDEVIFGTRLEPAGVKDYVTSSGQTIAMEGGEFKFTLYDAETGEIVAKAKNDSTGTLIFDRRIVFDESLEHALNEAKTYSYILQEDDSGVGIITDKTKYRIDATVQYISEQDWIEVLRENGTVEAHAILKYIYHLEEVNVYKMDAGSDTWGATPILTITEDEMDNIEESQAIVFDLRNEDTQSTFLNYALDTTSLTVQKVWPKGAPANTAVTVILEQNGVEYTGENARVTLDGVTDALETTAWQYTWTDLPVTHTENGNTTYNTYAVKEATLDGYLAEYEYVSNAQSAAYWVPATTLEAGNQYMIVNNAGELALNVTSDHSYSGFSQVDVVDITSAKVTDADVLQKLGREGQVVYAATSIPDWKNESYVFIAQAYKNKVVLKNAGYHNSWLQIYSELNWGGTRDKIVSDASFFEYNNGLLQGTIGSDVNANLRPVTYDQLTWEDENDVIHEDGEVMFTVSKEATDTNKVKLYTLVRTVSGGASTVTITNTPIEEAKFTLDVTKYKGDSEGNVVVDAYGEKKPLAGAKFELYKKDTINGTLIGPMRFTDNGDNTYQFLAETGEEGISTLTSTAAGKVKVLGLKQGTYVLKETQAPPGYYVVEDQEFTLNSNTYNGVQTFELVDTAQKYGMPETGGIGTTPYMFAGLMLIFGSVACLLYKNHKKEEGTKHENF